jgi:hypothetical protein
VDTLKTFRDRVDGLLKSLDAGAGSAKSISAQVMAAGHPGTGFGEVDALVARYQETHAKLAELSQTLSSTIDAMTISIDVARLGYENVDKEQIARLWSLHDQEAAAAGQAQTAAQTGPVPNTGGGARGSKPGLM